MKKQELNLSDEEKINFLATLKTNKTLLDSIKSKSFDVNILMPSVMGTVFVAATILTLVAGLSPITIPFAAGLAVGFGGVLELYFLMVLNFEKQDFKKLSNGKISYRKYKQLIKSGELARWEEQFKDQVQNKVEEIKGIKHEKYTKSVEKDIINQVKNSLPKDASLDSEKIAQEVKKLIESNNTKANQYNDLQK